jgi:hypothetical protein
MPTPQVFIVDERTFPLHLQYRFAGTTAKQKEKHIGLLADIARVRPYDPVIFYLIGYGFYGIFQIAEIEHPFWEKINGWLQSELGKPLIYRVLIEPLEVYRRPVSEWEAIDKLPLYSRDIRWSLLYRKLKGERGCSYIFPHEYESLKDLLKSANPEGPIARFGEPHELTWENGEIKVKEEISRKVYEGSRTSPFSHINLKGGEMHLQAWFVWHIKKDPSLEPIIGGSLDWFANEVFAGSGMQKMDILCIKSSNKGREFRIIELKTKETTPKELEQLRRYIWWIKAYVGKEEDKIQPIWITKGVQNINEIKGRARKIAEEESCEEPQIWLWELHENRPVFSKV